MTETTPPKLWTSADLDRFPDDGVERWIIDGVLWEHPTGNDMSLYSPAHASAMVAIGATLASWSRTFDKPRPTVYAGDVLCKLRNDPDTDVGIDIAVAHAAQSLSITADSRFIEGAPLLAVEILSPTDTKRKVRSKTSVYLACGTPVVWVVDPFDRAVTVYRSNTPPTILNTGQDLTCEPELPGFRCRVSDLFE